MDFAELPIRRLTFYKHGVAMVERTGRTAARALRLRLHADDLDEALGSLTVLDRSGGQVLSVDYELPEDDESRVKPLALTSGSGMIDLLEQLVGWRARFEIAGRGVPAEGRVMGLQYAGKRRRLKGAMLMLLDDRTGAIEAVVAAEVSQILPLEERIAGELACFMNAARLPADTRCLALRLTPGEHDLTVSYLVPAPAWRLSYRVIAERDPDSDGGTLLLQGWAQVDKRFDEDLANVAVSLVCGEPEGCLTVRGERCEPCSALAPLSLPRNSSALVPILRASLPFRSSLLFNEHRNGRHPVAALRIGNDSGRMLEQGLAKVVENGKYLGEAVLPATAQGAPLYLPLAVDASVEIRVNEERRSETRRLSLHEGGLCEESVEIRSYRYEILNRSSVAQTLTIERSVSSLPGELFETEAPSSRAEGIYRWELCCPGNQRSSFMARSCEIIARRHSLKDMRLPRLDAFLQVRGLEPELHRRLEALRAEFAIIHENDEQIAALENRRGRLMSRQEHLRTNIGALGTTGDEGEVRLKMVRELHAGEGALSGIEQLVGELTAENERRIRSLGSLAPAAVAV
jgi:hypothetical protein